MKIELNILDQPGDLEISIERLMAEFDDNYWLEKERESAFPEEFFRAIANNGWLGIVVPEELGGSGLGITEAARMMRAITRSPGGMAAASAVHMNLFGPRAIVVHGTSDQKQKWIPAIVRGESKLAFAVTEPDAGLNTGAITTRARSVANGFEISGRKIWTSTAQVADKVMILARTSPRAKGQRATEGLSLFLAELDRDYCDIREIDKMGRAAVDSNEVVFDGLPVGNDDLIGEQGKGFTYILQSMNPERILIGAAAIGIGQEALRRASKYAQDRVVFDRPIGQNQSIQHPLAECWARLEAAWLMCLKAAAYYDAGVSCGPEANAAKYLASEAGFESCERAILTLGGMGYAKEFHVERLFREVMITRLAPVSQQLILSYIAEKVLDLPKSY